MPKQTQHTSRDSSNWTKQRFVTLPGKLPRNTASSRLIKMCPDYIAGAASDRDESHPAARQDLGALTAIGSKKKKTKKVEERRERSTNADRSRRSRRRREGSATRRGRRGSRRRRAGRRSPPRRTAPWIRGSCSWPSSPRLRRWAYWPCPSCVPPSLLRFRRRRAAVRGWMGEAAARVEDDRREICCAYLYEHN